MDVVEVGFVQSAGSGAMWVQEVKLLRDQAVRVANVPSGFSVELYDAFGNLVDSTRSAGSESDVRLDSLQVGPHTDAQVFSPMGGTFMVRDSAGTLVLEDLHRDVWGGDRFEFRTGFQLQGEFYPNPFSSSPEARDRLRPSLESG
jgi:hypothetical protein